MPTRLQIARNAILDHFDQNRIRVHKSRELEGILAENREQWRLAKSMPFREFLEYLVKSKKLRRLEFPFPHRNEVRYTWGSVALESVLITLKPGCHFSHFTAVQMHELTEQDPRTIYLNHEQSPKPTSALGLAQERIDLAFKRKPRMTSNIASVKGAKRKDVRVCLLNGKHTGYVGVEERNVPGIEKDESISLRLTDIERTLIDIAVRPFYAGGAAEVLKAYERAAASVSINRLAATLRKLNYVYPYHQAVGFYLESTGAYDEKALAFFHEKFEYEFDFYLTYGMEETEYASRWRIHVPKGFIRQVR